MLHAGKIIKELCVTEKASELSSTLNQYVFEVYPTVNRIEIAKAVEFLFNVKVRRVNVLHRKGKLKRNKMNKGKKGRTSSSKRAIVSLALGHKIELA